MIPRRRYNIESDFLPDVLTGRLIASKRKVWVERFEKKLAEYLGGDTTVQATASGRAALAIILDTLGIPKGSTVMLPAYTLGSMGPFLSSIGYRWTTCDIDRERPVMTPETVMNAWPKDNSVKVVLATHLFGIPADVPEIRKVVKPLGAVVIEDCAHSIGSLYRGRAPGTLGDGAIFSFNYLKLVNCFGGGALTLRGRRELMPLRRQTTGTTAKHFLTGLGEDMMFAGPWLRIPTAMLAFDNLNSIVMTIDSTLRRPAGEKFDLLAMAPEQALHGIHSLETLDRRLALRRAAARKICAAAGLPDDLYRDDATTRANVYFLTMKVENASDFRRSLWKNGVDAGTGPEIADYLDCPVCPTWPNAMTWFKQAVQLPCHERLSARQIRVICDLVQRFK